ncbi:type II toxin-antitoxin system VapC family toxin [Nocardioides dongkuii]|uniref:type II toxin-antitoxin system VapC family toxin n=1 Tax=Nocardioides dongkuii TaxID=2760089 RepID=UPI001878D0E1|nr:type II toxin-antitoxin system VapC family toxin [Nocardioides dongkuii]
MPEGTTPGAVVDASALVDLLAGTELAGAVRARLAGLVLHAPAHLDVECLSALGRLHRAELLTSAQVSTALSDLAEAPLLRHPLPPLLAGAWSRRENLRLADSLYVELAEHLGLPVVTTDARLARGAARVELIG